MELSSPGKGQVQLIGFGCPEPEVSLEPLPIFEGQAPPPTSDCDDPVRLVGFHVNVNGEECSSPSRNTLPAKPPQSPSWAQRRDKFNRMTQDTRDWLLSHGSKRQEQQDKPEGCGGNRTNRSSGYSSSSNSSSTSSFGGGLPLAKAIETVFQLPLPPAGSFDGFRGLGVATRTYVSRSTKSTLEYVTDGATYSTERVSRSYHEAYDAVSESDDDEEEEEEDEDLGACSDNGRLSATPLREPSECGSTSDAELSCRLSPSRVVSICRRSEVVTQDDEDHGEEQRKNQLMKVANEVVATERAYVGVLHLIDQVFQFRVDNENRAHSMFPAEVVTHMFANVKSIYKFHHDFLLPQLEQRLNVWDKDPRLGDIMKNFAPFLKMYTEYVGNFDNAMNVINMWTAKSSRFASIVEEIQKMPECRNLSLQHHMLGPVQRIPRYQLLLKDYLKKLAPDSPDRLDSEKALQLVASAAHRANDALKKIDKFKQLLEVQESLGGTVDLVSPTRELVKEGRIVKISARSGDHQERYLFLFNDLLLLCSPRMIMANRVVAGPALWRVRAKLNVQGLEVVEGDNLETANTFYVFNGQKSIELYTSTPEEEKSWTDALQRTILDLGRRKGSLKVVGDANKIRDADLGRRPPPEVRLQGIASCARCGLQFGAFRRRHQCRACGEAVCNKCSAQKAALPYADNKPCRVCRDCHAQLSAEERDAADDAEKENHGGATTRSPVRRKGVLEVQATDHSAMCGYLHLRTQGRGRTWIQRWFALHFDCVLYSFKTHEDSRALTSTPLPGLTVSSSDRASETCERDCCFKLGHKKKTYWFQAKEADEARRWVAILDKASRAEPLT